jgi:hypothetical protein
MKCGVVSGIREYAVGPLLVNTLPWKQYRRRRDAMIAVQDGHAEAGDGRPGNPAHMRTYKVLDSGLSGGITGGLLNTLKRTLGPLGLGLEFIEFFFRSGGRAGLSPGITTGGLICMALQYTFNELGLARVRYVQRADRSGRVDEGPSESESFFQRTLAFIGLKRNSDEEYLLKLKIARDRCLKRIEQLEQQLEKERGTGSDT